MNKTIYLTGIKPTGQIHLGNYFSVIKPILDLLQEKENIDVYFFIADYHALTSHINQENLKSNITELMVSLSTIFYQNQFNDSNNLYLYRQSKIPQIFEYYWILSCFTAKGFLNRGHAYKSLVDNNLSNSKDPDKGVFAGVYNYPTLQAADIFILNTDYVPIGKDQLQHIEIANEIGNKINYVYGTDHFKHIEDIIIESEILPGTDGNKMSKSYGNTVNLMCENGELKKYIYKIKTNFKEEGEAKFPNESILSTIARIIGGQDWYNYYIIAMQNGKGWKELKDILYNKLRKEVLDYHVLYNYYKNNTNEVEVLFHENEKEVRKKTDKRLKKLKNIVGV